MNGIKGIILDIDGVIVGDKYDFNFPHPNYKVSEKIKSINENGIPIFLCTARVSKGIKKIVQDIGLYNLHISDGGAVVIDGSTDKIVKEQIIDNDIAIGILENFMKHGYYTELNSSRDYIVQADKESHITEKHSFALQSKPKIVTDLISEAKNIKIVKITIGLHESEKDKVLKIFNDMETGLTLSWGVMPSVLPYMFGIITAPNISKRQGAIDISEYYDIPFENMLGVGDGTSDWQFIELCKYRGIMGNASEELKRLAINSSIGEYYIGKSVDDNGLIDILEHFGL